MLWSTRFINSTIHVYTRTHDRPQLYLASEHIHMQGMGEWEWAPRGGGGGLSYAWMPSLNGSVSKMQCSFFLNFALTPSGSTATVNAISSL